MEFGEHKNTVLYERNQIQYFVMKHFPEKEWIINYVKREELENNLIGILK